MSDERVNGRKPAAFVPLLRDAPLEQHALSQGSRNHYEYDW